MKNRDELKQGVLEVERGVSRLLDLVRSNQKMRFSAEETLLEMHRLVIKRAVALDVPCPEDAPRKP